MKFTHWILLTMALGIACGVAGDLKFANVQVALGLSTALSAVMAFLAIA